MLSVRFFEWSFETFPNFANNMLEAFMLVSMVALWDKSRITWARTLSLSSILLIYTGMSVTRVFFICSATFGAMSIYGYTTKRDLTKLGSFLMMGLIGIIIASLVNIFMKSSMMYFVISILGVLIFVGLTAYDTQKIKNMYAASDSGEIIGKKAVMGALTLYLDFINLFIMLLRLFGQRR